MDESAQLARQMFFIGCFGLPWLWLLNALYFYPDIRTGKASIETRTWAYRSFVGSAIMFLALLIWIITFQTSWRKWSGSKDYMVNVPDEDVNNW